MKSLLVLELTETISELQGFARTALAGLGADLRRSSELAVT